jgi:sulfur relay (sulfurtransferase) DsrF/TusC family protein
MHVTKASLSLLVQTEQLSLRNLIEEMSHQNVYHKYNVHTCLECINKLLQLHLEENNFIVFIVIKDNCVI